MRNSGTSPSDSPRRHPLLAIPMFVVRISEIPMGRSTLQRLAYACCVLQGLSERVERTCDVEADRYLPYRYHVTRNGELTEHLDSLWVPRGELTELLIAY